MYIYEQTEWAMVDEQGAERAGGVSPLGGGGGGVAGCTKPQCDGDVEESIYANTDFQLDWIN